MDIEVARAGTILGTYSEEQISELIETGDLRPDDLYRFSGTQNWTPIGDALVAEPDIGETAEANTQAGPGPLSDAGAISEERPNETPALELGTDPTVNTRSADREPSRDWRPSPASHSTSHVDRGRYTRRSALVCCIVAAMAGVLIISRFPHHSEIHDSHAPGKITAASPFPMNGPAAAVRLRAASPSVSEPGAAAAGSASEEVVARDPEEVLRDKVAQLPGTAQPPIYASYRNVEVQFSADTEIPGGLTAMIKGDEDLQDETTHSVRQRTKFILGAAYRNGRWVYTYYRATTTDLITLATTEQEIDPASPVPPSIVSVIGLATGS